MATIPQVQQVQQVQQFVLTGCNRFASPEGKVYEQGKVVTPADSAEAQYLESKGDFKKHTPPKAADKAADKE